MISTLHIILIIPTMGLLLSFLTLTLQKTHLLSILLSLEAMTLNLFILLLSLTSISSFESYSCLILLTLGACEASIALATLVSLIRTHGNDYVLSLSTQKC
uniref:NADH-ubiquinone oxidoreductase chain 4L n=1 Tax=Notocrater youngi TaxID=2813390 RepID=A0A894K5L6_9VEST|nr:NADH dehydrogenase subunit 4L [Notocrater youngi]